MTSKQEWAIRPAVGNDLNFIYSTWLNSYRHASRLGSSMRKSVFFKEYYGVLDDILARAKVLVACLPEEPTVILAFFVYEHRNHPELSIIHYAFTKESFRSLGIQRSLVKEARLGEGEPVFHTHETRDSENFFDGNPCLIYNPFLLFSRTNKQT